METNLSKIIATAQSFRGETFTAAQLVVAAWEKYPAEFCLEGFPQHPDSNKILAYLMGKKGIVAKGVLMQRGPKRYSVVTPKLAVVDAKPSTDKCPIAPALQDRFLSMVFGPLADKFRVKKADIRFTDAVAFWRIEKDVDAAILSTCELIREFARVTDSRPTVLNGGMEVDAGMVRALHHLNEYLLGRFEKHLLVMRGKAAV